MPRSTTTTTTTRRNQENDNEDDNALSAFGIHEDALYQEVDSARKRLAQGHVSLADALTTGGSSSNNNNSGSNNAASFCDLWDTETARISDFLQTQQQSLEFSAKALLVNVEAAMHRLVEQQQAEQEASTNSTSNSNADASLQRWQSKTDALVKACRNLQRFGLSNRQTLQDVGTYADEQLSTSYCLPALQRRFAAAPWKTGVTNSTLIVVLSDIYQLLRTAQQRLEDGAKSTEKAAAEQWVAPSSFERSTTKYWVQDGHQLTDLLLAAVSEAPLLVYGKSGRLTSKSDTLKAEGDKLWDQLATPITSIYLDNPTTMALYQERLARREGAQLLRARWYGRKPVGSEILFLELKTHHEKWINTKSVKERVAIREKDMVRFLDLKKVDGEWTLDQAKEVALAATPSLEAAALDRDADRLLRMRKLVVQHKLEPCVRTCYLRAAFQSSNSNALRLTIDRNITMIDETKSKSSSSSKSSKNKSWCLAEDAVISNTMANRVPFVVLEVKLAGDDALPPTMQDLAERGVIQEATKFSKFLTGAASFHLDQIDTLPYWAEHPAFAEIFSMKPTNAKNNTKSTITAIAIAPEDSETTGTEVPISCENITESPEAETCGAFSIGTDGKSDNTSETSGESRDAPKRRLRSSAFMSMASMRGSGITVNNNNSDLSKSSTSNTGSAFGGFFRRRKRNDTNAKPTETHNIAPKRPARVEPKSYFANERTFIQWISAALLLVTISVILLGIDSEMGSTSTYARKSGIGVCCGAVVIVFYATYVYFRRLHLLSTGNAYGYIDHVGPFILATSVCVGVCVLLIHFLGEIEFANQQKQTMVYLHEEPGQCYLHSNRGISKLEYQPSDVVVDSKRNILLVPSLQRIVAHTLAAALPNRENRVKTLVEIPDSNIEALTVIDDRVFALSEGPKKTELIELAWNGDDELSVSHRWKLSISTQAEGMTYVPDKTRRSGRLLIDVNTQVNIYEVPDASAIPDTPLQDDDEDDDALVVADTTIKDIELERIGSLNNYVLTTGLKELKISSMFHFEGIAYILHDNEKLLRAWDLDEGDLLFEMPLPWVEGGYSKEWEGLSLERRVVGGEATSLLSERDYNLRGSTDSTTRTELILHLALDTPAQVWSMVVKQGDARGSLILPSCAISQDESKFRLAKRNEQTFQGRQDTTITN